jgi:uncharacterized protein CbrC (UPF0167 family)
MKKHPPRSQGTVMPLPKFKYHPDPLSTGSIVKSGEECVCCGKARGYLYAGPVYSEDELDDSLCPWCIANGRAHEEFDASFTDEEGIGGGGEWDSVSEKVIEEVAYRTPGFSGWQEGRWWTHCGDAAAFIGRAGKMELLSLGKEALSAIQNSAGLPDGEEWEKFLVALDKNGSPTAYVFRCGKCGAWGGYQDCD